MNAWLAKHPRITLHFTPGVEATLHEIAGELAQMVIGRYEIAA